MVNRAATMIPKRTLFALWLSAALLAMSTGCASSGSVQTLEWWNENPPIPEVDISVSPDGVVPLPLEAHGSLRRVFDLYTKLVAPSGRPIHILGQRGVDRAHLVRARELMRFFLTDVPGSRFGSDKAEIANEMADRWATLVIFKTQEDSYREQTGELPLIPLFYQDLYVNQSTLEGTEVYRDNQSRDETLESVFHLVHGAGIRFAAPEYHVEIRAAAHAAVRDGLWSTNLDWILDGSTSHQYVTNVLEVYYGIWAHDPHGTGRSFGGNYGFIDREGLRDGDPLGIQMLEMFLPASLDFDCELPMEFDGSFSMAATEGADYTQKSRYLRRVKLRGSRAVTLRGNELDNLLAGNAGDNQIEGGGGHDAVTFRGAQAEYEVVVGDDGVEVTDSIAGRDGRDLLTGVECLHFSDRTLALEGSCEHGFERVLDAPVGDGEPDREWGRFEFDMEAHTNSIVDELLACFDTNFDGTLSVTEPPKDIRALSALSDVDRDGVASRAELVRALEAVFAGEVQLTLNPDVEVDRFFDRFDLDRNGRVERGELPQAMLSGFEETDANGDGAITREELLPSYQERE